MDKIGQEEICNILEKVGKPLSRVQIAELLGESPDKVSKLVHRLIEIKEIKFIEVSRIKAKKLLGDKAPLRRLRLYYI